MVGVLHSRDNIAGVVVCAGVETSFGDCVIMLMVATASIPLQADPSTVGLPVVAGCVVEVSCEGGHLVVTVVMTSTHHSWGTPVRVEDGGCTPCN